jgi:hypothetical protein
MSRLQVARRLPALLGVTLAGAVLAVGASRAPASAATSTPAITVEIDKTTVSVGAGQHFTMHTVVRNEGDSPLTGLITHLNIAALDPSVYVDPEDWSGNRTQYLPPLPAHSSRRLTWRVQAVNDGRFILYVVAVQPASPHLAGSDVLSLRVARQPSLGAASALPVALGVPVLLLGAMGLQRRRRRRLR